MDKQHLTIDGYPIGLDYHHNSNYNSNYNVVEHNPTGLPPEPNKERAEEILQGSELESAIIY